MRLVNLLGKKRNQKETKHVVTNSTTERKVKIFARMFLKSNCFTSCSKSRAGAESDRLLYKVLYFVFLHHRLCHISEIHDLMYFAILLFIPFRKFLSSSSSDAARPSLALGSPGETTSKLQMIILMKMSISIRPTCR